MKKRYCIISIIVFGLFTTATMLGQESCKVLMNSIKGEYKGDCKDGLADGKGTSIGKYVYEGSFKKGMPHGEGEMLYEDGSFYIGYWKKGLRQGEGIFTKVVDGKTTVSDGIWKKNKFIGKKKEKPYKIITRLSVPRYTIRKVGDTENRVTILVKNNGAIYRTPPNINTNSGTQFNYQGRAGFENIQIFPFTCEMRYSMPRKIHGSYIAEFNFTILEKGDWLVTLNH